MRQGVGDRGGLADRPEGQRNPRKQLHFGCGSAEGDPGFFWFGDSGGGCRWKGRETQITTGGMRKNWRGGSGRERSYMS